MQLMRFPLAFLLVLTFVIAWPSPEVSAQGNDLDYGRLAHPEVAESLGLSDAQRAEVQQLLQQRAEVVAAEPDDQAAEVAAVEEALRDVLTSEQLEQFKARGQDTGQLQFKFQQQPWPEVLQWFASQEGLTLVMNQVPPGTFTYNDNRSYTTAEAIDLLNSVLLTRGYTLVRREKMLTVLQLSSSIPIELIPRVTLEELPSRGRFELVSVLFPLGDRPVDAVLREVEPYLGAYGRALPLPQSKQLLVIETAGKMATINVLISSVPEPKKPAKPKPPEKPPAPVFAAYTVGELDPTATLETVQSLVGSERITIDEKSRVLTAYVIPEQQTAIQSYLEAMRTSVTDAPASASRAYEITAGTGEQLREQVLAIAPQAKVTVDAEAQQLYVTAPQSQQQAITEALQEMGITSADLVSEVKAFRVAPDQATSLAAAMESMLPEATVVGNATLGTIVLRGTPGDLAVAEQIMERWKGGDLPEDWVVHTFELEREANAEWLELVRSLMPQTQVQLADDQRGLLLLGTAAQKTRLESLLPQLEKTLPKPNEQVLETRILPPEQLARWEQLEAMVGSRWPEARTMTRQRDDGTATELWVWADPETQQEITELLEQLKQPDDGATARWPKQYSLEGRPRALVEELLRENHPGARISDLGLEDALTVWASPDVHEAIGEMMADLSQRLPAAPQRELQSYRVRGMTGSELEALLTPLTSSGELAGEPAPTLTVDPQGRRLLVFATPKTHASIAGLIRELEQPLPAGEETVFLPYTLEYANAADVKTLLEAALEEATIVADESGRQLVVTATLAGHARIKTLLEELDRPVAASRQREMRAYAVEELDASSLLSTLESMWPRMSMSVDEAANKIIATGTSTDHAGLAEAIGRLNTAPGGSSLSVESYPVPAGDLKTLPNVLLQLAPSALISADTENRVLVVWASEKQHARIAEAIEQLQKSATDRKQVEIYRVVPDQTAAVQTVLGNLFPEVTVSADPALGQLTVLANETLQERIGAVILKVSDARDEAGNAEPRSYEVPDRVQSAFRTLLETNVPRATVISNAAAGTDKVMVLAASTDHQRIEKLLQQVLAQVPDAGERTLKAYPLGDVDPTTLKTMMTDQLPEARVVSGAGTDSWLVSATPTQHEELQSLLEELGGVYGELPEPELRVYRMREDLVSQATSGIAALFPQITVLPSPGTADRISVLAKPEEHNQLDAWLKRLAEEVPEPEESVSQVFTLRRGEAASVATALSAMDPQIEVTAETAGNRVVVTAMPEQMERISKVIEQIEAGSESGQTTESYVLESGSATTLSTALTASFPEATIVADATNNVLVISASPEEHQAITRVIEQQNESSRRDLRTETYVLAEGSAVTFSAALEASFPRAVVAADRTSNALVVSATPEDQEAIATLIEQQNAKAAEGRTTRSYRLEDGNATTLRLALQASFPQATVAADTANNVLVVSADEADQAAIAKVIDQQNEVAATNQVSQSYRLKEGSATTLRLALQASFPKATIAADTANNVLIVSAEPATQASIAQVIEQQNAAFADQRVTRSYRLEQGNATTLRVALQAGFPQATIGADATNNLLIVSADPEDQEAIAQVIDDEIGNDRNRPTTQVYRLEAGKASTLRLALRASFPEATIGADSTSNVLVVSADPDDQAAIGKVIQEQNASGQARMTQSYVLEEGSASTLRAALQSSFPEATVVADASNNVLVVSADQTDQQAIAEIVEKQNSATDLGERLDAYVLQHADPETVAEALENAFGRRSGVGVSLDRDSSSVFVVGVAKQQKIAAELVAKLDQPSTGMRQRKLKTFSLAGIDGSEVADSVENLFEEARPPVDVRYDFFNEQLVVIANDQQLELLEETLEQFDVPDRQLEIVALTENDPETVRSAIDALFEDIPINELPSVTVDQDRQQLLIRATAEQQGEIAKLLRRLGERVMSEADGDTSAESSGGLRGDNVRTIPVGRDAERLLERLREVWPDVRGNPIRVIEPTIPAAPSEPGEDRDAAGWEPAKASPADPRLSAEDVAFERRRPAPDGSEMLVYEQTAEQTSGAESPTANDAVPKAPDGKPSDEAQAGNGANEEAGFAQQQAVIIVPGAGRWTVVSEDREALNLLEKLVGVAVSPPVLPVTTSGNTSVYVLQHADAEELEQVFESLFRPARRGSRQPTVVDRDNLQVVADRRINALIVKSSRADRGVIEDLLAVLDSPEFIDALRTASPQIIPIQYADAQRVSGLVSTVYAEQVSSDAGRPEIEIPAGVSDEVATLLQQINAETAGPLLNISVDEVTNSIIMRAPPELATEVRAFVDSIDQRTATSRAQKLRIIPLRGGNAASIGEMLDALRGSR